jgi:hypothetical protein
MTAMSHSAEFTVLAGDFKKGTLGSLRTGWSGPQEIVLTSRPPGWLRAATFDTERIDFDHVASVERVTEQNAFRFDAMVGVGAVAALLAGPVGLLLGMAAARAEKDVIFVVTLADGRKLMAKMKQDAFKKVLGRYA